MVLYVADTWRALMTMLDHTARAVETRMIEWLTWLHHIPVLCGIQRHCFEGVGRDKRCHVGKLF